MAAYISSHLKDMNRKKVFEIFLREKVISRTQVGQLTGISMPTVLKIFSYFEEKGLIACAGESPSALGRKAQLYRLNAESCLAVGVEIEGDYVNVGIVDLDGKTIALRQERAADAFPELLTGQVRRMIHDVRESCSAKNCIGVGIALPGIVNAGARIISDAPHIGVFEPTPFGPAVQALRCAINLPVDVDNDVNAAAYAEYTLRREQIDNLVYISYGSGLGAGLVLDGRVRKGPRYSAGEIGQMIFDETYTAHARSQGWLESKICLSALARDWGFAADDAARLSIAATSPMLQYAANLLAMCMVNIVVQLDIPTVILGGIASRLLGPEFVGAVRACFARMHEFPVEIFPQTLENPSVVGMALQVFQSRALDMLSEDEGLEEVLES